MRVLKVGYMSLLVVALIGCGAVSKQRPHQNSVSSSASITKELLKKEPSIGIILAKLGLKYADQLEAGIIYKLDEKLQVTKMPRETASKSELSAFSTGFNFSTLGWGSELDINGTDVKGKVFTSGSCLPINDDRIVSAYGYLETSEGPTDPNLGLVREGVPISPVTVSADFYLPFHQYAIDNETRVQYRLISFHFLKCGASELFIKTISSFPKITRRIALVIDDSGSMAPSLAAATQAIQDIALNTSPDPSVETQFTLLTFKDDFTPRITTSNPLVLSALASTLVAGGGGDCPEESISAMFEGGKYITSETEGRFPTIEERRIVLLTDASARNVPTAEFPLSGDGTGLIEFATANNIAIDVLQSGDCADGRVNPLSVAPSSGSLTAQNLDEQTNTEDQYGSLLYQRISTQTQGRYLSAVGLPLGEYVSALRWIIDNPVGLQVGPDTTPPKLTVIASPNVLWPPTNQMVKISTLVSASDNKDPHPVVTLAGISAIEPDGQQGSHPVSGMIEIKPDGSIYLRASKSQLGGQLNYFITYKALDSSGNLSFKTVSVVVPKTAP